MGYIEELRAIVGHRPVILVGVAVLVFNEANELLLQMKHGGVWAIPGGLMELGESAEETGRREVLEETGLVVGRLKLLGVVSGPEQFVKLPNGDEFYAVTILYSTNEIVEGELRADGVESVELRYFDVERLPEGLSPRIRKQLEQVFGRQDPSS